MAAREEKKEKLLDFKKIGAIMRKNAIVLVRDKTRLIPLLMFPIFMIVVLGFVSGNVPKHIPTALVVYDNSPLSQQIQNDVAANQIFSVQHVVSTEDEAKTLLDEGKVRVIVEIPVHLQQDIDAGKTAQITVIVDESDSSILATAQQTMNAVVAGASAQISQQKLIAYQASVATAAAQVQDYINMENYQYSTIASHTSAATTSMTAAVALDTAAAHSITLSEAAPTILTAPAVSSTPQNLNGSETYVSNSPANAASQAEISILESTSALVQKAVVQTNAATSIATQANLAAQAQAATYNQNVQQPLMTISAFTQSSSTGLITPLTTLDKPAYSRGKQPVDFLIPAIIALTIFQGAIMGMGRAVAGEKREGSLTRVFLTPTSNATIILGTLLFYVAFELCRATFLILVAMTFFHISIQGNLLLLALILAIYIGISTAIGMILSSLVKTEQQFMAMAMLVSMPTIFLAGVFFPLQAMPLFLQDLASIFPVTYAGDALRGVMVKGFGLGAIIVPVCILLVFLAAALVGVFAVFKRDIE